MKALPASLPESVRMAKMPAVKEKIFQRLKAQRGEQSGKQLATTPAAGTQAPAPTAAPLTGPPAMGTGMASAPPPPPGMPPPPPPGSVEEIEPVEGIELCGDEPWFADVNVRRRLRQSVEEAHKDQKILVGLPADEVSRICPADGRVLGAGAVLRLGGAHLGGYGESDIAYAYRQLSRALHPDKNPDLAQAPAAFHRLSEASDELRQGLSEQRTALQRLVATMGGTATQEMLNRPQEALMAEACRMLTAVCFATGEGEITGPAQRRAIAAFHRSSMLYTCQMQTLLAEWFETTSLLDVFGGAPLRTAYDCSPKRYRAQFLCLLNRAVLAEAKRCSGCVRGGWSVVMQTFPELGLWREMREKVQQRVWDVRNEPEEEQPPPPPPKAKSRSRSRRRRRDNPSRSRSRRRGDPVLDDGAFGDGRRRDRGRGDDQVDPFQKEKDMKWDMRWKSSDDNGVGAAPPDPTQKREHGRKRKDMKELVAKNRHSGNRCCRWARKWRAAICSILPSAEDGAAKLTDKELRKIGATLWKEVVAWIGTGDAERGLGLFKADHQTPETFGWDGKVEAQTAASRGLEPGTPPADWAFVPVMDLLLILAEGLIGITAEGVFADSPTGHKRIPFALCYKKRGQDQRKDTRRRDRRDDRRDERSRNGKGITDHP